MASDSVFSQPEVRQFFANVLQWPRDFVRLENQFRAELPQVLESGNQAKVLTTIETYLKDIGALVETYPEFPQALKDLKSVPLRGIVAFPHYYRMLEIRPAGPFRGISHKYVLGDLWEGKSDPDLGHICDQLLAAFADRLKLPPVKLYDNVLEQTLQDYEAVYRRVRKIWLNVPASKREETIYHEFPGINELDAGSSDREFQGDFQPADIALNVVAQWRKKGFGNVSDLRRALAKARKVRKALKAIDIEFAPPLDTLDLQTKLAESFQDLPEDVREFFRAPSKSKKKRNRNLQT